MTTGGTLAYVDTSAFVKLIIDESESAALTEEMRRWSAPVSSALLAVEAVRACRRLGEDAADAAEEAVRHVALLPVDDLVLRAAARLDPSGLRTLDAVHLATAISIGPDLGAFVAYDERLIAAALARGLPVVTPS